MRQLLTTAMAQQPAPYLIDGFPRSPENMTPFEEQVGPCRLALLFEVSDELARERMAAQGKEEELIARKLRNFTTQTMPIAQALEGRSLLRKVSAADAESEENNAAAEVIAAEDARLCAEAAARGARVIISNNYSESIRKEYWRAAKKAGARISKSRKDGRFQRRVRLKRTMQTVVGREREQVEEICEGADKQLGIETKLQESRETWSHTQFQFGTWKGWDCPILQAFGQIIDDLEEAQMNMQTLLSMRHVGPFREPVQEQLTALSDTADTLELWIKVQLLWTALESVFMGLCAVSLWELNLD